MIRDLNAVGEAATPEKANAERLRRRIDRLRNAILLDKNLRIATIERAVSVEDLRNAYGLVHDIYVEQAFMSSSSSGMRLRVYEAMPEMATFVAKIEGQIVAVLSALPDMPEIGLPADHAFRNEIDMLRSEGRLVCEITNNAVTPEYRNSLLFLELTRACFAHAQMLGCDDLFACITPKHARFFGEFLQFSPWGIRRDYSQERQDPVEGNRLDLRATEERAMRLADRLSPEEVFLRELYYTNNPYHRFVEDWARDAASAFGDPAFLKNLFVRDSDLLGQCGPEELNAIYWRWGPELFEDVFPPAGLITAGV